MTYFDMNHFHIKLYHLTRVFMYLIFLFHTLSITESEIMFVLEIQLYKFVLSSPANFKHSSGTRHVLSTRQPVTVTSPLLVTYLAGRDSALGLVKTLRGLTRCLWLCWSFMKVRITLFHHIWFRNFSILTTVPKT